jgi:hypothetical protein
MPDKQSLPHGVMEGKGAYNRHAKLPAGGAALAMPLWEEAVRNAELEAVDQPIVIADYGSSQGKNSLAPMLVAISALRGRFGPSRAISVFHIDQPSNDFNTLFEVLHTDPERYGLDDPNVFPGAIGRSFYESVLPANSVHLGWSSYAAVWLSHLPALIPGHFISVRARDAARCEFERQGARDWEAFLSLRATELRCGDRLVVVLPALNDDGFCGLERIMDGANIVLAEMVAEGSISAEERDAMVLGAYPRRKRDLLDPFSLDGKFQNLTIEALEVFTLPDAAWTAYERDGDQQAWAAKHALFFRSIFIPSLASALTRVQSGDNDALRTFADRLESGLKRHLATQPAAIHSFVQTMVLAKRE